MASVESSIFYERQPYLGRSSSKIMERLDSEKGLLKYKEKKLEKLPTLLKTRQTAAEKQEALFNNQSKSDADRDRFKRDRRANMLREVKEMQILLPKEIEEVKEKIKSLEGELAEAEAREEAIAAKRAAIASNIAQSQKSGHSGDAQAAQKRKGTMSGEQTPPKKRKTDLVPSLARIKRTNSRAPSGSTSSRTTGPAKRPPPPSERFKLSNRRQKADPKRSNKDGGAESSHSTAPECSANQGAASPAKRQASEDDEEAPQKKRQKAIPKSSKNDGAATSSKSKVLSSYTASKNAGSAKRSARADNDGAREYKRRKTNLENSEKAGGAASLNSAAPSGSTVSRGSTSAKRSAPEDDDDEEDEDPPRKCLRSDPKRNDKNTAGPSSVQGKSSGAGKGRVRYLRGLFNHQNACFSNAVIQLFDAAFEGHDIDNLLGRPGEVKDFGLKRKTCEDFDKDAYNSERGKKSPRLLMEQGTVRDAIKAAAKAGETKNVSPALHLRNLLEELHQESPSEGKSNAYASPLLFQSVAAWGSSDDVNRPKRDLSSRQRMSGDTQEDSFEYYLSVLNSLVKDEHNREQGDALKSLFEVKTETTDVCPKEGCGYKSDTREEHPTNYHDITVPETTKACNLSGPFKKSTISETDRICPNCFDGLLEGHTTFVNAPESLVMRINRAGYDSDAEEDSTESKVKTKVELDRHKLRLCNAVIYELSAVVCHRGNSLRVGHYTIFRKHGDKWYLLDDKWRKDMKVEDVGDSFTGGQSAMLLWKKVQA